MSKNKKKLQKKQKRTLLKMFVKVVMITLIVCGILAAGGVFAYQHFIYVGKSPDNKKPNPTKKEKEKDVNETLAVFGVDIDGYRTDVIFLVNFNSQTNKVKVVSVPRDTKVYWSEGQQEKLNEYRGHSREISKLNEMTSYGGIEHIRDFTIDEIQNITGVTIDNYAIVTIDAFRKIVDAIDGVEVDVPVLKGNGLQYDDYAQGFHVHLSPGVQTLNGEQAEGLVRFRKGYVEGDVARIRTQQLFLKAFADKVLSPEMITKLPKLLPILFESVTTDLQLNEMMDYYGYIKKFDMSNLSFDIIPGEPKYESGAWYYIPDTEAMPAFIDRVFYDKVPVEETTNTIVEDKTVTIEVLNATDVKGAAGRTKDELEKLGYNVERIDNYKNKEVEGTVIYAKNVAKAEQFKQYFETAKVEQNSNLEYDIQIVLGSDMQ